ncbi:MAG: shikimate dehydrogenase [Aestuariibacter sp.]
MLQKYAVFGNPIQHSLSPKIHQLFAKQFGHDLQYDAIEIPIGQFAATVPGLIDKGLLGANVTAPFKGDALAFAKEKTERASLAGAANTLVFNREVILADNTDGAGLVHDLRRLKGNLQGSNVLLIGAGGASKGVVLPLYSAGVEHITITNRTIAKAEALAQQFSKYGQVQVRELQHSPDTPYDIIINCTSSSMQGSLPGVSPDIYTNAGLVYDMFYHQEKTPFLKSAEQHNHNVQTADGIGMLVGQAAESYRLWWNESPDIQSVIESLRP